jgi:hypothetical protein
MILQAIALLAAALVRAEPPPLLASGPLRLELPAIASLPASPTR